MNLNHEPVLLLFELKQWEVISDVKSEDAIIKTIISNKEIYSNNLNDFRSVSENYNVIISSNDSGYFFGGRCFSLIDNNIHNWVYGDITDGSERFSFSPFYGFDYTIIK